ncbi:MAG: hypothetical protein R2730_12935 [Chitinophagales bacterium]
MKHFKLFHFRIIIPFILLCFLGFSSYSDSPSDFEYELTKIVRAFKANIMDEDECEDLKYEADDLADDIEDALDDSDNYTREEILKLKQLKKEAEALEEFIACVGHVGNYIPTLEDFNLANKRVRANVAIVSNNEFCIDVIVVNTGDYVAYLGKNSTDKNFTVSYEWKAVGATSSGNGTMGLSKQSVRHIYDNRDKPNQSSIKVFNVTCKEF